MTTTLFPGVALIVGAASGIGQATAVSFLKEGCRNISIADRNVSGLDETKRLMEEVVPPGKQVEILVHDTDVTQESQVEELIIQTARQLGRIDYAVNCAGILPTPQKSHETPLSTFDQITSVNYRGCWLSSRAAIKQMLTQDPLPSHDGRPGNRGSVVNIASQLGLVGRPAAPVYCASKAAVINMTKCDAIDYSASNIRVNCICPGPISTPMTQPHLSTLTPSLAHVPLNRFGTAQEIADAVLFLCSSKASFVQGAAMVVDGGYTIT